MTRRGYKSKENQLSNHSNIKENKEAKNNKKYSKLCDHRTSNQDLETKSRETGSNSKV
jgi:hypothetical protein